MNGDIAQYNDVVNAACETFNLPFYYESMRLPIIVEGYNMFCHVCITPMRIIETKCLKRNNETTQKTGDLHFSTLIDFVSLPAFSKTEGQHSTACGLDEAFDNFLVGFNNTLRRLFSKIVLLISLSGKYHLVLSYILMTSFKNILHMSISIK